MSKISVDYANILAANLPTGGVDASRLSGDLAETFADAYEQIEAARERGEMGFFDLPYAQQTLARTQELADGYGQWFENLVILGIGGSGLGARTLRDALLGPLWNEKSGEQREHFPRIYVVDNVDPTAVRDLLGRLDLRKTLFNVVSKSGSTAETMAAYLVVEGLLIEAVGAEKARGHFLFTTDPFKGALRRIAEAEEIPSLPVPENVGGRFSVLSPVGLLPAAVAGIDISKILQGARDMDERCRTSDLAANPAGLLAVLLHTADAELSAPIHVMMPYANRLRSFTLWFQQLWAESLGKVRADGSNVGPTPLPAIGATDQHAQVQLFMEGPLDKVVVFIAVDPEGEPVSIPNHRASVEGLGYLGGHSLDELLDAERRATTEALRRRGLPNLTISIGRLTPESLGGLLMLWQIATVYAGVLYGIDPMSQPGVELGKQLTYGLMGREGYSMPELPLPDPKTQV